MENRIVFRKFLTIICLASGLLFINVLSDGYARSSGPLTVVTTNSILDDLLRQVAGDWVESKVLVGANGDPHTFEPTPRDNVILKNADLIFENGLHL